MKLKIVTIHKGGRVLANNPRIDEPGQVEFVFLDPDADGILVHGSEEEARTTLETFGFRLTDEITFQTHTVTV